eukprot:CAMPEP_0180344272 /NCGR_PEP_ID=MMETSP0989-20121125/2727_1 /TAXON_ID=697907 /ORGANISM="non described non described, Strain CCMP2293" /LENGTH=1137 /DNA_ID=CAMNT_0022333277 /DNA_START=22 /DNA_END=3432 /DNA_ORIENTATION=-
MTRIKDVLFGVVYIMTEGLAYDTTKLAERKVYFLLFVDVLQVLRAMSSAVYGWTAETKQVVSFSDIVFIFSYLVSTAVPRYTLYILAMFLVLIAIVVTWYVGKLFESGAINKLWPVKLLRFMVASIVTIYFSSVIKWMLIPIDCLVESSPGSFSASIHGEGAPCTPFAMPEVLITVPTLFLAAVYIIFSLVVSFLAIEINPLSQQPRALFTGRVEVMFLAFKIACTLLVYLAQYLTPITITAILMFFAIAVFRQHVLVLPFHNPTTNNVRGGIMCMVVWWSIASFSISVIITASGNVSPDWLQNVQWVFVAFLPPSFIVGYVITSLQQASVTRTIELLKGDWEAARAQSEYDTVHDHVSNGNHSSGFQSMPRAKSDGWARVRALQVPKRTVFDKFFDTSKNHRTGNGEEWARQIRFSSEQRAIIVARELLYRRDPEKIDFLEFVITRAMEEWPESDNVMMLNLLLLRFVNRRWDEATALERQMRLNLRSLPTDHQYTLHVVERKSTQDAAGSSKMGARGQVSALSLLEFEVGMDKARTAHKKCLSSMRNFWKLARKSRHSTTHPDVLLRELLEVLETNDKALSCAKREYSILLEKYPTSTSLHQSYAHFCDSALNHANLAEKHRKEARELEGDTGESDDGEAHRRRNSDVGKEVNDDDRSNMSSNVESHRTIVAKQVTACSDTIMDEEVVAVWKLMLRVRFGLMLLVVLATAGFLITDFYLFSDVAMHNLELIDTTGIFRAHAMSCAFLTRTQMIAAHTGDIAEVAKAKTTIYDVMDKLRVSHLDNYEGRNSQQITQFYTKRDKKLHVPYGKKWIVQEGSYWELINDFTLRVENAAAATPEELVDPNWKQGSMSQEKAEVTFVHENINRLIIPMFENVLRRYEIEVNDFGMLTTILLWVNAGINFLVLVILFFLVMRGLRYVMQTMHYNHLACVMALQLPPKIANLFDLFYRDLETQMRAMEDENIQHELILEDPVEGIEDARISANVSAAGDVDVTTGVVSPSKGQTGNGTISSPIDEFVLAMHHAVIPTGMIAVKDWEKHSDLLEKDLPENEDTKMEATTRLKKLQSPIIRNLGAARNQLYFSPLPELEGTPAWTDLPNQEEDTPGEDEKVFSKLSSMEVDGGGPCLLDPHGESG